jgi:hypothetical protein
MTGMENADPRVPGSEDGDGETPAVENGEIALTDALAIASESSGAEEV